MSLEACVASPCKKKILCLCRYSLQAANTRYRVAQYFDQLQLRWPNSSIEYAPVYSDHHLDALQRARGRHTPALYFRSLGQMLRRYVDLSLRDFEQYDAIIATADLIPWLPFIMEARAYKSRPGVVIDLDDARWVTYSRIPGLRRKYGRVLAAARHVIAGNAEIARYALRYTSRVTVIPTVVDVEQYKPKEVYDLGRDGRAQIGWIGTPVTTPHLLSHSAAFQSLARKRDFVLHCIGVADGFEIPGVTVRRVPWSAQTEKEALRSFDIGVMPLPADDFARGKSGLKLIQYLAAGLPALASAVGANSDIVTDGVNGLLAHSVGDFGAKLERLVGDRDLRRVLGTNGRKVAAEKFSLQSQAGRFAAVLA